MLGRRLRNIHPAGTTLHANDSLPISDNSFLFELVCFIVALVLNSANSDNRAASLSSGSFASWLIVSSKIPGSGRLVVGPITFSGLISVPTWPQSCTMSMRATMQTPVWGGPAKKSHPDSEKSTVGGNDTIGSTRVSQQPYCQFEEEQCRA